MKAVEGWGLRGSKTKLIIIAGLVAVGVSIGCARIINAAPPVTITSCADFATYFPDASTNADADIVLANDIDCSSTPLTSLFDNGTFTGTFDGQGHTISNLTVLEAPISGYTALFSATAGAYIHDLNFDVVTVDAASSSSIGVVASDAEGLVMRNVHVTNGYVNGGGNVGGLVGNLAAYSTTDAEISNSSYAGSIDFSGSTVGGIVGSVYTDAGYSLILNDNIATAVTLQPSGTWQQSIGGIVGNACVTSDATILRNTAVAPDLMVGVSDPESVTYGQVGGIAGQLACGDDTLALELASSTVTGTRVSGTTRVGGLVGYYDATSYGIGNSRIHDEHLSVDVYSYGGDAGGVFGYLSNSDVTGTGTPGLLITNVTTSGDVTGNSNTGGFAGQVYGKSSSVVEATDSIRIEKSYATGTVTANAKVSDTAYAVGGFIGYLSGGTTLSQVYSSGAITAIDHAESNSDPNDFGGLVGYMYNARLKDVYSRSSIAFTPLVDNEMYNAAGLIGMYGGGSNSVVNAYATGDVFASWNGGGLSAYTSGTPTVTSSYWDTETTGWASSTTGIAKTTAEMTNQATFIGWDFATIWDIQTGVNDGYPFFRSSQEFNPDVDGDGVPNSEENGGPNGGDANNDGVRDSDQPNVTTAVNGGTGDYVSVAVDGGTIDALELSNESDNATQDSANDYPAGFAQPEISTTNPGDSVDVEVYYSNSDPTSPVVTTYDDSTNTYLVQSDPTYTIEQQVIGGEDTTIVSYSLTDGAANDTDGASDSSILGSLVGVAVVAADDGDGSGSPAPSTGSTGGNGSGDVSAPNTGLHQMSKFAIVAALVAGLGLAVAGGIYLKRHSDTQ